MTNDHTQLGLTVDAVREELGVSVPELAQLIERDRTHLWRALRGQANPSPDLISRCLVALGEVAAARKTRVTR